MALGIEMIASPELDRGTRDLWVPEISRPYRREEWSDEIRDVLLLGRRVGSIRRTAYSGHKWIVELQTTEPGYRRPDGTPGVRSFGGRRLEDALTLARGWTRYPVQRWIGMSGQHGCLPDYSGCCATRDFAIQDLAELFELGERRIRALNRYGILGLVSGRDGAEYCEVTECTCPGCTGFDNGCLAGMDDCEWSCPECGE